MRPAFADPCAIYDMCAVNDHDEIMQAMQHCQRLTAPMTPSLYSMITRIQLTAIAFFAFHHENVKERKECRLAHSASWHDACPRTVARFSVKCQSLVSARILGGTLPDYLALQRAFLITLPVHCIATRRNGIHHDLSLKFSGEFSTCLLFLVFGILLIKKIKRHGAMCSPGVMQPVIG
jgi:hypothetical protein